MMKTLILSLIFCALSGLQKQPKKLEPGSDVQINLLDNKKSYKRTDVINFNLTNLSKYKIWVMVGDQFYENKWQDGMEDLMSDPRRKEQVFFLLKPGQKKSFKTYNTTQIIAEQRANDKQLLATSKDPLTQKMAFENSNRNVRTNPFRLIVRCYSQHNKLIYNAYSTPFKYVD